LNAAGAARKQSCADFLFEVAYLAAEGRLCGMEDLMSRDTQAAGIGNRHKITNMAKLHGYASQVYPLSLQSISPDCQFSLS
jgi:hypothetical protein